MRPERNKGRVGNVHKDKRREFQTVGTVKEKEQRSLAERISGTVRRWLVTLLRFLLGLYGVRRSERYKGCWKRRILKVNAAILKHIRITYVKREQKLKISFF